jgi:ferrochelatase
VRRILLVPLYPQYSATSSGTVFDAAAKELVTWRWVPELRTMMQYHDVPGYIDALAASVRELWDREGEPEKLVMSFHGIPKRYFEGGDPYHCHCQKTGRLLAEKLGLAADRYLITFQSLFGKEEWLQPYTDKTMEALGNEGIKNLDVICPGFAADCLETLEEIKVENKEIFLEHGGERFRYIPALNDRADIVATLSDLIRSNLQGWVESRESWDAKEAEQEAEASACQYAVFAKRAANDGA